MSFCVCDDYAVKAITINLLKAGDSIKIYVEEEQIYYIPISELKMTLKKFHMTAILENKGTR